MSYSSPNLTPSSTPTDKTLSQSDMTSKNQMLPPIYGTSPLFSKEKRISINRMKCQLEIDVISLRKKLKTLTEQLYQIKTNIVSFGELTQLKAGIRINYSAINSKNLSVLMDDFVEIVRENYELEATCEMLNKRIIKETKNRQKLIDSTNKITELFDFSDFKINMPVIRHETNISQASLLKKEIIQLTKKLGEIKEELQKNDIVIPPMAMFCSAAETFSRKAETGWQIRSLGTNLLRIQIQNLQKQIVESNSYTRKIEESISTEQKKLSMKHIKFSEINAKNSSNNNTNLAEFERQITDMDQIIFQLKKEVSKSFEMYETINNEIQKLSSQKLNLKESDEYFENTKENEEDSEDNDEEEQIEENDVNTLHFLQKKKEMFLKDISELTKKYNQTKTKLKKKEMVLKISISRLTDKYLCNKKLVKQKQQNLIFSKSVGVPIDKEMTSIIEHIDTTITELRSEYAS